MDWWTGKNGREGEVKCGRSRVKAVKMPPVIKFQIKKSQWAHQGVWFNPTTRM